MIGTLRQYQESVLNLIFRRNPYPTRAEKEKMANMLGMTFCKIYNWFRSKRHLTHRYQPDPIKYGKYRHFNYCGDGS